MPREITISSKGEKFSIYGRSHGISLKEGRKLAICDEDGYEYVLGENVYNGGTASMNLKLQFQSFSGLFVGITEGDVKLLSQNMKAVSTRNRNISYEWPGSYGWVFNDRKSFQWQVCKDGTCTINNCDRYHENHCFPRPYTLKLILKCKTGNMSLHLPTGHEFHMDIPKARMWRLNVTLCFFNQRISIED